MKYYLDTNICIYFLKGKYESIRNRLQKSHPDEIKICSIVKAELLYGAEKSNKREDNLRKVSDFLFPFEIVAFDDNATKTYAKIRSELEKSGKIIGPNDLLIASTVLEHDGVLVTHNSKEFERVKNLHIEDWVH